MSSSSLILRASSASLINRLVCWSLLLLLIIFLVSSGVVPPLLTTQIGPGGFFAGWSGLTVFVACWGAAGGLLVALSVKHSDSGKSSLSYPSRFFLN